jgi:hypothetical protein
VILSIYCCAYLELCEDEREANYNSESHIYVTQVQIPKVPIQKQLINKTYFVSFALYQPDSTIIFQDDQIIYCSSTAPPPAIINKLFLHNCSFLI